MYMKFVGRKILYQLKNWYARTLKAISPKCHSPPQRPAVSGLEHRKPLEQMTSRTTFRPFANWKRLAELPTKDHDASSNLSAHATPRI